MTGYNTSNTSIVLVVVWNRLLISIVSVQVPTFSSCVALLAYASELYKPLMSKTGTGNQGMKTISDNCVRPNILSLVQVVYRREAHPFKSRRSLPSDHISDTS